MTDNQLDHIDQIEQSYDDIQERNWQQMRQNNDQLKYQAEQKGIEAENERKRAAALENELNEYRRRENEIKFSEDEDYARPDHVQKIAKRLDQYEENLRKREQELQQQMQLINQRSLEASLSSRFPDYNKVITPENLERLKQHDPVLA